jgi:ribonuclease G
MRLQDCSSKTHSPCKQDILINWSPQETRVAVVENGAVQELHVERTLERGLVGNVYLGKVARVLPGMQSAFIDIGLERAAFLHVADVWHRQPDGEPPPRFARTQPQVPIESRCSKARPDGAGHQGPDRHQGRAPVHPDQHCRALLVFLPQDDHIGVSQKIPRPAR